MKPTQKCEICGKDTALGEYYLLPKLIRQGDDTPVQLVVCSKEHHREWLTRKGMTNVLTTRIWHVEAGQVRERAENEYYGEFSSVERRK